MKFPLQAEKKYRTKKTDLVHGKKWFNMRIGGKKWVAKLKKILNADLR